ncbi:MAG: hypothetical protein U0822_18480 [Anaerolineae bacterium]
MDYLRPRLFEPLGIEDPYWETDPRGISIGGSGLHIRTDGIARQQMYLQKGMWQAPASNGSPRRRRPHPTTAWQYPDRARLDGGLTAGQFWRCRHDCYRGDGAFGQYCVIMPEQDAVLAINSGLRDMQVVLDNVWEYPLARHAASRPSSPTRKPMQVRCGTNWRACRCCCWRAACIAQFGPVVGQTYSLENNDLKSGAPRSSSTVTVAARSSCATNVERTRCRWGTARG